eukprot:11206537-Lingulodinium_polyedra.AAC.1
MSPERAISPRTPSPPGESRCRGAAQGWPAHTWQAPLAGAALRCCRSSCAHLRLRCPREAPGCQPAIRAS